MGGGPKLFVILGVGLSCFCSFFWFVLLVCPANWLYVKTAAFDFEVNLFSVFIDKGTVAWAATTVACAFDTGVCEWLTAQTGKSEWISEAKHTFCSFRFACDDWNNVWAACWVMVMCGFLGVISFGVGGVSMAYYAMMHATEIGRKTTHVFLWLAPSSVVTGLLFFMMMTMNWGEAAEFRLLNASFTTHASYGQGFICACVLSILSFLPIFLMAIFSKANPLEKRHGEDADDLGELYGGYPNSQGMQQGWPNQQMQGHHGSQMGGHHGSMQSQQQPWGGQLQANGRQVEMQMQNWPQQGAPASGGYGQRPAPGFGGAAW